MPFDQQDFELAREVARGVPQQDLPAPVDPVLEVLVKARARVVAGWCRGPFATDVDGKDIFDIGNEEAMRRGVCFCADGALWREFYEDSNLAVMLDARAALDGVATGLGYTSRVHLNGDTDQAAVVSMYDAAIAARKAGG